MLLEYANATMRAQADGAPVTTGVTCQFRAGGGTFAATGTPTHKGGGNWELQLSQAERANTQAVVQFSATGALTQDREMADVDLYKGGSAAPIDEAADGQVITAGTVVSGSYTDTSTDNGVYFQTEVGAGALDIELFFDLEPGQIGQGIVFSGRFDGGSGGANKQDFVRVRVYNYKTAEFEDRADIVNSGASDITWAKTIPREMTAPDGDPNPGRVRIQFLLGQGDNGDDLYIDQCTVSGVPSSSVSTGDFITAMRATIPEMVYQDGAVWVDTIRGAPGRIIGFNGTPFGQGGAGPSNNVGDAIAIAAQLNTRTLRLAGDSKFTLDQGIEDGLVIGEGGATLNLGNQDITSAVIRGCTVDGIGTHSGEPATFSACRLVNATASGHFVDCRLTSGTSITLNDTRSIFDNCFDFEPGTTGISTIDCGSLANLELTLNDWTGRIKLINVSATAVVNISDIDGYLDISDASVNAAAQFTIAGVCDYIGTPNGTIVNETARISQTAPMTVGTMQNETIKAGTFEADAISAAAFSQPAADKAKADVSNLDVAVSTRATQTSVDAITTTGGAGPWTTASTTGLALETTSQEIKTKTDQMTFTVSNQIDSNAQNMRGTDNAALAATAALEASVQTVITTGGPGPWTTGSGGGGLTEQQVRDAMKLAPSAGAPAAGSVDEHLDDIDGKTTNLPSDPASDTTVNTRASQTSVDAIDTKGGAGPWTTADTTGLALEATSQQIVAKTDNLPADPASEATAAAAAKPGDQMDLVDSPNQNAVDVLNENVYHAKIDLTIDEANVRDEYSICYFKNDDPIAAGITVPTIAVKQRDGTTLIATTALTDVGDGQFTYNASGAERSTPGEAVIVTVEATIDGATRTWADYASRDSEAPSP